MAPPPPPPPPPSLSVTTTQSSRRRRSRIRFQGAIKDLTYLIIMCAVIVFQHYQFYSQQSSSSSTTAATTTTTTTTSFQFQDFAPPSNRASNTHTYPKSQTWQQQLQKEDETTIPLNVLTASNYDSCNDGLVYLPNRLSTRTTQHSPNVTRTIPKIIHMTSKSRCFSKNFADNIRTWEFPDHDLYLHDDEAVERLLSKYWSSFPHIPIARKCLRSGAGTADLWRYLVLWEYGGIYTDIDNSPGKYWNESTISNEDDAFFVIEKLGVLSQYFMAISPRHPLMYLAVHQSLHRVLDLDHVGKQNIPVVTGPGALKVAFKYFMRTQEILDEEQAKAFKEKNPNSTRYGRVKAGKYYGVGNRSVTVAGTKDTGWQLVIRGSVEGKSEGYGQMGMRHFSKLAKKKFNESCLVHLWNLQYNEHDSINFTNW